LNDSLAVFFEMDSSLIDRVQQKEEVVDNLQKEIIQYLVELSQRQLGEDEAEKIPVLIHSVNDVERVGDHAINILELAQRRIGQKLPLGKEETEELRELVQIVHSMFSNTSSALMQEEPASAHVVLENEDRINTLQVDLKAQHIERVNRGGYNYLSGIIYIDFVDNMEKIGDHLSNIAQGVLRHLRWDAEICDSKV